MPSSNLPPEEQPEVKPFDPLVLDRTVIAVPLLNEMKEDLSLIETVEKMYPEAAQKFNAAIEFNKKFPGGVKAAREKVLTMAEDAKQAALETSKRRLEHTAKELLDVAQKRHDALAEGIEKQTIGPLQPLSDVFLLRMSVFPYPRTQNRAPSSGFSRSASKSLSI